MTGASLGPGQWVHHVPVPPGPSGRLSLTPGMLPAVGETVHVGEMYPRPPVRHHELPAENFWQRSRAHIN